MTPSTLAPHQLPIVTSQQIQSPSAPAQPGPGSVLNGPANGTVTGEAPTHSNSTHNGLVATPELLAELAEHSKRLESATPQEIIAWAVEAYAPKLTMATAFGPEGCVILHMLAEIDPGTYVFNLDTGYQFKETLELRDKIEQRYGLKVDYKRANTTVEQYEALHGGPLYKTNSDQCCFDRKVTVLREAVVGWHAWMSGIRRDQGTGDRAGIPIVGWDKKFNLVKISPLAN